MQGTFPGYLGLEDLVGVPSSQFPEAGPKSVRHGPDLQRLEQVREPRHADGPSPQARKHARASAVQECPRLLKDFESATAQRGPVLAHRSRARGRDGPHGLVPADLRPTPPDGPRRSALPSVPETRRPASRPAARTRRPHGLNRRRHLAMRQRPHVPHHILLRSEHRADPVARVVGPKVHRHGPLHDRARSAGR